MKLPAKLEDRLRRIEVERADMVETGEGMDAVKYAQSVGFEPDEWQAGVLRWQGKRLILNCARQSGKSTIASFLAVHQAIHKPDSLILLISPSLRQSSELFRKVSEWFGKLPYMPALTEDNKLSATLANGSRIVSLPSREDTIRGFSAASLIIEDEASRVSDALYMAVRPMLAVSGGRLILMSTPFGKRGHFYEAWENGGDEWERVKIRADQNPRISPAFLAEEREAMGEWWFKQEYLGEFADSVDNVFATEFVQAAISPHVDTFDLGF